MLSGLKAKTRFIIHGHLCAGGDEQVLRAHISWVTEEGAGEGCLFWGEGGLIIIMPRSSVPSKLNLNKKRCKKKQEIT